MTLCNSIPFVQSTAIQKKDLLINHGGLHVKTMSYLNHEANQSLSENQIEEYKIIYPRITEYRLFANVPNQEWHRIGLKKNDFIVDCKIYDQDCYDDFLLFVNPMYYNCYTFTSKVDDITSIGSENGLSIILKGDTLPFMLDYNPYSKSGNSQSVRVVIHEKNSTPQILDEFIEIMPGVSTFIGTQIIGLMVEEGWK